MSRRSRLAALAAASALLASCLAGCSLIGNPVEELVERGVEDTLGEGAEFGLGEVPTDFPGEVPLPEGEVVLGAKPTADSWMVTIRVPDEASARAAADAVEGAGFTPIAPGATIYRNDAYDVAVQWAQLDDGNGGYGVGFVVAARSE